MKTFFARLLGEGFRVFFLMAGLYGLVAMLAWEGWLDTGALGPVAPAVVPSFWHAHEMIFGYATAAMGGFFLTAVPNWTGAPAARHVFIGTAAAIWLAGRVAMWFAGDVSPLVIAVIDLAFLPVLGIKIASQLIRRPKPQNMMFLGLLALIWTGNLMVHLQWLGVTSDSIQAGLRGGLLGLISMITVLGGRVTPAFTRNAMNRAGARPEEFPFSRRPVEVTAIGGTILLTILILFAAPGIVLGPVAVIAGLAQLVRLTGWRTRWALGQPILWSLHLAMGMLGLGEILLGLAHLGLGDEVAALHILGIGAVGGMTIAVMSRASLGHSGRPLVAPRPMVWGYVLMALAAVVRWSAPVLFSDSYIPVLLLSGALWIAAFVLFLIAIGPALTGPRVQRMP